MSNIEKKVEKSSSSGSRLVGLAILIGIGAAIFFESKRADPQESYPPAIISYDPIKKRDIMLSEGKTYERAPEGGWKLIDYSLDN